jgi:hypothetical protein
MRIPVCLVILSTLPVLSVTLVTPAAAQNGAARNGQAEDRPNGIERTMEGIARQPFKDIGVMRENPPEILREAQAAPYTLAGIRTCRDLQREIGRLDVVLGPDVDEADERGEALPARLADAGARTLLNTLIPFRGLVREATGAAEADRRLRNMVTAASARRGFLKGHARARGCRA